MLGRLNDVTLTRDERVTLRWHGGVFGATYRKLNDERETILEGHKLGIQGETAEEVIRNAMQLAHPPIDDDPFDDLPIGTTPEGDIDPKNAHSTEALTRRLESID